MVQINFGQREVSCKVVFYGPGMSGKTTNLEVIHKKAPKDAVGEMVSIATETDRTLYFDFLPLDLGQVAGMRTKFQLYTVPGQIYYNATRKLVLQGVDGVIFVADSNPDKMAENLESFQNLRDNLAEMGLTVDDVPVVLQYNKRDLPNASTVPELNAQMNPNNYPTFEACARDGKGVFATLKEISRLVIEKLNREHAPAANRRRTANLSPTTAAPVVPVAQAPAPAAAPAPLPPAPPRPVPPAAMAARPVPPQPVAAPTPGPRPTVPGGAARPVPPAPMRSPGNTPSRGNQVVEDPKNKHLTKPKPPSLDARPAAAADVGATEPNLRKYHDQRSGGGGAAAKILLAIVVLVVVFVALVLFVKPIREAVRPFFPAGIQRLLMDEQASAPAMAPAPAAMPMPVATPAPVPTTVPAAAIDPAVSATPVVAPVAPAPVPVPAPTTQPQATPNGQ